jgi:hypothetical protein
LRREKLLCWEAMALGHIRPTLSMLDLTGTSFGKMFLFVDSVVKIKMDDKFEILIFEI